MGDCLSQDEGRSKGSSISVLEFLATVFENIITALTEILVEHTEKTLTNVRVFYWPHKRRFFGEISFGFIQLFESFLFNFSSRDSVSVLLLILEES